MKTILVVEDDPVNQMILSDFLSANDYTIVVASSGPEGLSGFDREKPHLCLVDVQLPHKNGLDLVREMKQRIAATPVLLMSAEPEQPSELRTLADGYLAKPFDLQVLLEHIRRLIGRS